jgi:ribosomal protein S12 methylthiotransferase accessory factor YcaO
MTAALAEVMGDVKKLEPLELLRLELLQTRISLHAEATTNRMLKAEKIERDAFLKALELRNEGKAIGRRKAETESELSDLLTELSEKYGLDLRKATYDDVTGIICELAED